MANENNDTAVTHETPPESPQSAGDTATPPAPESGQGAKRGGARKTDKPIECEYSAEELALARSVFQTSPDIVEAALMLAGKDKATIPEAKRIVKDFMERKV